MKKLQLELENINCQYKETVDGYQKDLEAKKATEEKLLEEVSVPKYCYDFE